MGYNYYILIQGLNNNDTWIDLDYGSYTGSYHSIANHYFYNDRIIKFDYQGDKNMGDYQYIFGFNKIQTDYEKLFLAKDKCLIIKSYLNNFFLNKENIGLFDLEELKDIIQENLGNYNQIYGHNEIINYYNILVEFKNNYNDVRIIFGICA